MQDPERVGVERLREQVAGGGQVLARHRTVRARAVQLQVPVALREQRRAGRREHVLQVRRHLPGQQPGAVDGLLGQRRLAPSPRPGRRTARNPIVTVYGTVPRTLHPRADHARLDVQRDHLALAGVAAAAGQPGADRERLQHLQEPP